KNSVSQSNSHPRSEHIAIQDQNNDPTVINNYSEQEDVSNSNTLRSKIRTMINDQYQPQENESKGRSFLSHIRHRIDGADHGFQTKLRRISPILTLGASDGPSSKRIDERSTEEEME
ncbi:unnamed protein product, partial [Brassica oleracea var. botrytis]